MSSILPVEISNPFFFQWSKVKCVPLTPARLFLEEKKLLPVEHAARALGSITKRQHGSTIGQMPDAPSV
jgi:hypothetical protein